MNCSQRQILRAVHKVINNASTNNIKRSISQSIKLHEKLRVCTDSVNNCEKVSVNQTFMNGKENDKGYGISNTQKFETSFNVMKMPLADLDDIDLNAIDSKKLYSPPDAMDTCKEDLSHITRYPSPTFNFAAYADKSETIKQLVDLGVDLFRVERRKDALQLILPLDFEHDVKPYVQFLHDIGVPADYLGFYITRNPFIFKEDLEHLHTRIKYLKAHNFSDKMIQQIMIKAPSWLLFQTQEIDRRLGYFQATFKLNGEGIRRIATICPTMVINKMQHIRNNTFAIKEEMGFNEKEMRAIILKKPIIWRKSTPCILETFDYLHNQMEISHQRITNEPVAILCRKKRLEYRHKFLQALNKAQYNPEKPLYVSLRTLVSGTDVEFCMNVANVPLETYNEFLKTF